MYCPFSLTFRRCIFVRQVQLAPGRFVLPSGHARTQPARAFPAQTVKAGWTLLSTGSVVVLVLQALMHLFLPGFFMNRAVRKAGQRLERTEPAPARPLEEEYIKDHQGLYQLATAKNIRLGSHTQTHTRSIPRSMGYGSKGGCVIQALGSHNHHHHYYNHLCCCYCYSLLSAVLPPPQI